MREFFQPFRRKLGALTLVLACGLMVMWIRSGIVGERLSFATNQNQVHLFSSNCGNLSWTRLTGGTTSDPMYQKWDAQPEQWQNVILQQDEDWVIVHAGKAVSITLPGIVFEFLVVPYWSIVLPLTLVSAWLLLGKARKSASPRVALVATQS